jgi:antitoxin ParD1/3/4
MEHAEKLSITLTPQMAKLVRDSVASGRFASASEVIRDAMRAWQQKEREHEEAIASIRARVQASLDDPRPLLTGKQVMESLKKRYDVALESLRDKAS